LILENIAGSVAWSNVNKISATGNTENIIVDPGGTIINRPTVTGHKSVGGVVENLDFKSVWALKYQGSKELALVGIMEPYSEMVYYYAGVEWLFGGQLGFRMGYTSKYDAVSIALESPLLALTLFTDNISLSDAQTLGASISLRM
jgi:hypothetical protein